jgi:hypothetical protein
MLLLEPLANDLNSVPGIRRRAEQLDAFTTRNTLRQTVSRYHLLHPHRRHSAENLERSKLIASVRSHAAIRSPGEPRRCAAPERLPGDPRASRVFPPDGGGRHCAVLSPKPGFSRLALRVSPHAQPLATLVKTHMLGNPHSSGRSTRHDCCCPAKRVRSIHRQGDRRTVELRLSMRGSEGEDRATACAAVARYDAFGAGSAKSVR